MESGKVAYVDRSYFPTVDAAFVLTPEPRHKPSPLSVLSFASPSMPVTVNCKSGPVSRTVVEVQNNCGVLHTYSVGVHLYLDEPAKMGDSGALICAANNSAVGLYRGAMNVPSAPTRKRGLAQNFEQAVFALDVFPYL